MLEINENDKILIVRLSALGDCIHTIPLACALKKKYPNIFVGWAVGEKSKDVVLHNPILDKVHIIPKKDSRKYKEVINEIKAENYTIAIDSQELLKSAWVSFSSTAKHRLAHDKSREFSHLLANERLDAIPLFDTTRHVIERNMDFARYLGIENTEIDFILPATPELDKLHINGLLNRLPKEKKTVVVAPATTWVTKFWTIENWALLLCELNKHVNLILTGSNADKNYIEDILSKTNGLDCLNLTGKTNILQLKELFANSDIVICPDSGSAHLASAVKRPVVISLFGATSSVRNGAYGDKNKNLSLSLSCQPCYKKVCKFKEGIPECMTCLKVETVLEAVKRAIRC